MPQGQLYDTAEARIDKVAGELLAHAIPMIVLGSTGKQHQMRQNMSKTVIFRRFLPFGGATTNSTTINQWGGSTGIDENAHLISEGVTPSADTLIPQNITVQVRQYGCLYMYSDEVAILYEDNIPDEMKIQAGERMGLVKEMICYGALKACTNASYAGGTTLATVDEVPSLNGLRQASRTLLTNLGKPVRRMLMASEEYATAPVEPAFNVYHHTHVMYDARRITGFLHAVEFASGMPKAKDNILNEWGAVEDFRFFQSPHLVPYQSSGAGVGTTRLISTDSTSIDVYPMVITGADAYGDVALRGLDSFKVNHIAHDKIDKSDPGGQRGYIGAFFFAASFVQNDGWMQIYHVGATDL